MSEGPEQQHDPVDVRRAVEWAARNRDKVVKETSGSEPRYDWKQADSEPPPLGKDYLKFAVNNPTAFMKDVVLKVLATPEDDETEGSKEDAMQIEDIQKVLEQFRNVRDAKK